MDKKESLSAANLLCSLARSGFANHDDDLVRVEHLVEFVHLYIDRELLSCLQYFPVLRSMRNFCERIQVVFLKAQENVK
jgi:hypothetical protein